MAGATIIMKQVFNKITNKFEMMHHTTANELVKKDKATILADDATLECLVLQDCHIAFRKHRAGEMITLSVVESHKWQDHGYVKIQSKKKPLENKLEKVETETKEENKPETMTTKNITKKQRTGKKK